MHRERTARTAVDYEPDTWRDDAAKQLRQLNDFCDGYRGDVGEDSIDLDEFIAFRRGQYMPRNHIGPQPGKCFMSLNLSEQQMGIVQDALIKNGAETEEALAQICGDWLEHYDLISAQPQLLKTCHELLDYAEGTAGDNKGRPWEWIEKAKAVVSKAEGNT